MVHGLSTTHSRGEGGGEAQFQVGAELGRASAKDGITRGVSGVRGRQGQGPKGSVSSTRGKEDGNQGHKPQCRSGEDQE